MDAISNILVRRYRAYNPLNQPMFFYNKDGLFLNYISYSNSKFSGWLVDWEKVVSGPKWIVFFESKGSKFIDAGGMRFKIDGDVILKHARGLILSRLCVIKEGVVVKSILYLTPWWRLIFDDGSHPDLHFPLEHFSKIWNEKRIIF